MHTINARIQCIMPWYKHVKKIIVLQAIYKFMCFRYIYPRDVFAEIRIV
jgi:hypothetical protein